MCVKRWHQELVSWTVLEVRHKRGSNTCSQRFKILPLFDYCDIAWSNFLQQHIDRLQRLQNRSDHRLLSLI